MDHWYVISCYLISCYWAWPFYIYIPRIHVRSMKHLWFISWVCYVDDANSSCTGLCVQNDTWLITNNNYVMTIWINHGLRIIQTKWVHFNFVFNFVPLTLKDLERWQWENICFLLLEQILKSIESHFICHGYDFMVILNMF